MEGKDLMELRELKVQLVPQDHQELEEEALRVTKAPKDQTENVEIV
jgi:hypothetical protein